MLLYQLVEYAKQHQEVVPPPFYKSQPVRWALVLDEEGAPQIPILMDLGNSTDKRLKNGSPRLIPSITKTSGIAPKIAVDTAEYLFGWVCEGSNPDRVNKAHEAFLALNDEWVKVDPDGPGRVLQAFYRDGHAERFAQQEGCSRADQIAVRVKGKYLHETESAQRFWAEVASSRKTLGIRGVCLVCGKIGELLKTIPQQLPSRLVPLATQSASLVSINKATHGFNLQEQLVHTPVCVACGLGAISALEEILSSQTRSALTGQGSRLAWWVTGDGEFDYETVDRPTPERVATFLARTVKGQWARQMGEEELSHFCALTIGGNVSRVMIRDWIDMPLYKVQENVAEWFSDHETVDAWTGEIRQIGIGRLAQVSGRWIKNAGTSGGAYAKFGASGEDRPEGVQRALLNAALFGKRLPPGLLTHVVRRIRTDGRLDAERVALIRLALRRLAKDSEKEAYLPVLNPENNQPAYVAGRIFAVLEDIQLTAARVNGDDKPNTTYADRYFGRAVTSPAVALVAGQRDAQAWLKRMGRVRPAFAQDARNRLSDLYDKLANAGGIPHGTVLADQAAFILGYHQQWAELRSTRGKSRAQGDSEEGATE